MELFKSSDELAAEIERVSDNTPRRTQQEILMGTLVVSTLRVAYQVALLREQLAKPEPRAGKPFTKESK